MTVIDKIQHWILGFVLQSGSYILYSDLPLWKGLTPSIVVLLSIELVQADCWGEVREINGFFSRQIWWFQQRDTRLDLLAGLGGIATFWAVLAITRSLI